MIQPLRCDPTDSTSDTDGRWLIFMADVSGHGPAAAVMMGGVGCVAAQKGSCDDEAHYIILNILLERWRPHKILN